MNLKPQPIRAHVTHDRRRHTSIHFDSGNDEPGMTLQRLEDDWVDYKVDGKVVKSPVDIDALPAGRYRLTNPAS
jgi:hypothetical protein